MPVFVRPKTATERNRLYLMIAAGVVLVYVIYRYVRARRPFERFTSPLPGATVRLLSGSETAGFLAEDTDRYVATLSPADLYARRVSTPEQYLQRIVPAAMPFPSDAQERVQKACAQADAYLRTVKETKMAEIPWLVALTHGREYEEGLPHTRQNTIFLSTETLKEDQDRLTQTMIHEKVHLYQRRYPEEVAGRILRDGFTRWRERASMPLARANPDLDAWVYLDRASKEPMVAIYTSSKPAGITDVVITDPSNEHPYEKMAYDIARGYLAQKDPPSSLRYL